MDGIQLREIEERHSQLAEIHVGSIAMEDFLYRDLPPVFMALRDAWTRAADAETEMHAATTKASEWYNRWVRERTENEGYVPTNVSAWNEATKQMRDDYLVLLVAKWEVEAELAQFKAGMGCAHDE